MGRKFREGRCRETLLHLSAHCPLKNGDTSKLYCGQPKPEICFRGQGLRITAHERAAWNKNVVLRFQPKAWYDDATSLAFAEERMPDITADARAKGHESVVITDNLHGQTTLELCEALWIKSRSKMRLLPTGVTDLLQLIDAGFGYLVKFWLGEFHTQLGFKWPGLCASSCSNLKYQLCLFLFRVTRRGLVTVAASHIYWQPMPVRAECMAMARKLPCHRK